MNYIGCCATLAMVVALLWVVPGRVEAEEMRRLRLINDDGFGDRQNTAIGAVTAHEDCLYLGTWNSSSGSSMPATWVSW